jgi:hypothetical protein
MLKVFGEKIFFNIILEKFVILGIKLNKNFNFAVPLKFFYHLLPLQAIYFHTFPHYM